MVNHKQSLELKTVPESVRIRRVVGRSTHRGAMSGDRDLQQIVYQLS
ncbi:MAG: hypothetical protein Q8M16_19075 [Pirellulaceae bacterium]|nr:hypothetical protein [Pirellulaceae bacterium]